MLLYIVDYTNEPLGREPNADGRPKAEGLWAESLHPKAEGLSAEGRRPKAGRRPEAEGRRPEAEGPMPKAEGRRPKAEGLLPKAGPEGKNAKSTNGA